MSRAGVSAKSGRARHVEAWFDGSELDMFKERVGREPAPRRSAPNGGADDRLGATVGSRGTGARVGSWTARATDSRDGIVRSGRRTVTITGRGAERYNPRLEPGARPRPQRRRHERTDFRPDRAALWAVVLCVALLLLAAASSHAAPRSHAASRSRPGPRVVPSAAPAGQRRPKRAAA